MSQDTPSCKSVGGELEKRIIESPEYFPCEILDFIEEAKLDIFSVINDNSIGRNEAWTQLIAVIEKWFGAPREKGVLESIKAMLHEKIRKRQKAEDALQYKKIASEAKRMKLE